VFSQYEHFHVDITYRNILFLAHLAKGNVSFCHHLASVVCKLFTFQASSPKPLGRLEPNLAGMFFGWSSTKLLFFVPVGYSIWLPGPIICSDWLKFQRWFRRRSLKCEKFTDDRRRTPSDGNSSPGPLVQVN
jgi:hypothetical protein